MWQHLFQRKPPHLLQEEMKSDHRLRRILGAWSLTSLGVGCIIGAGIFVITGYAAHFRAGPSLTVSFVVAGLACVFSAFCYGEFASMAPVAGSAYTYAFATMGELLAWIVGWDMILEYSICASTVAHGWSKYFQNFIGIFGLHVPKMFSNSPLDYDPTSGAFISTGSWFDLSAVIIVALLTAILVLGIRESTRFNNFMVAIKVSVVLMVIAVGAFFVDPARWQPFAPYGWSGLSLFGKTILGQTGPDGVPVGMLAGAAIIFFAYIGFDSVSTHAEEAVAPQRDVPIGIIASLLICTLLYVAVTMVLTGMVPYDQIDIQAPIASAFERAGLKWAQFIIALGAVAGLTSVMLVLMLSQARVLMAMARDGLLPRRFFGDVHPRFRTPWKATILTGIAVATVASVVPLGILAELVNIGTLLAFIIVCGAVLIMRHTHPQAPRPFRCPMIPLVPLLGTAFCLLLMFSLPAENWLRLFIWLLIGLMIYFFYGRHHSILAELRRREQKPGSPA